MIYFIQAETSGHVKIGKANDPVKRLGQLRTGSHERLTLLGSIPGGTPDERRLHQRFAPYRVHGEWFRGEPALMAEIQAILFPAPPKPQPAPAMELIREDATICPCCGHECTRVIDHKTVPGGDNYEAGWGGRGDLLVITFAAECGAGWDLCFGFHKGATSVFVRVTRDCREPNEMILCGAYDESDYFDEVGMPSF